MPNAEQQPQRDRETGRPELLTPQLECRNSRNQNAGGSDGGCPNESEAWTRKPRTTDTPPTGRPHGPLNPATTNIGTLRNNRLGTQHGSVTHLLGARPLTRLFIRDGKKHLLNGIEQLVADIELVFLGNLVETTDSAVRRVVAIELLYDKTVPN